MATHIQDVANLRLPETSDLRELAERIVRRTVQKGASASECVIREGREFATTIRLGEIEALKEAGGKSLGIRVFLGQRAASVYTSDFSWPAIEQMIDSVLAIAKVTSEDPFSGLPESDAFGQVEHELEIYSPHIADVSPELGIDLARRCERAALEADPRLKNSDGASFDASEGRKILANSLGFVGEYRRSHCSISAVPIAEQDGRMQRDYWFSMAHDPGKLESPEEVGRKAAERTLRRLGARKVATARVPVVFDPMVARSMLDHIFQATNGDSVYRNTTFLAGKLGQPVANARLTVIDDGARVGGFGSSPFDGEGLPTRRTVVIQNGVLSSYLLNTYTARKLGLASTGNAARGLAGTPGVGFGNFYIEPGTSRPADIIRDIRDGLYVTEFIGMGVNMVTGDYSRGASGLWIANGELSYPVEEITVAGNLQEMLRNISLIGDDLEFRSSAAAPTLVIEGLTVGGA